MNFYITNLIIMLVYTCFIKFIRYKKGSKILLWMYLLHLSMIAGFRAISVGTDTILYKNIYNLVSNQDITFILKNSKYVLYSLLMKMNSLIVDDGYQLFLIIISILTNGILLTVAYRFKEVSISLFTFFYIVLFYYMQTMNITRQYLAISLCFLYFYLLMNNKVKSSIIVLIGAILIHTTSSVAIIFVLLKKITWNPQKYGVLAIVTTLVLLFYEKFYIIFVRYFNDYSIYMGNSEKYSSSGNRIWLVLFILLVLLFGIYISSFKKTNYPDYFYVLQSILVISSITGLFFSNNQLIVRLQLYFEAFVMLYIPLLFINKLDFDIRKITILNILIVPVMLVFLIPFILQLRNNYGEIIPYHFFCK